MTSSDWPKLSVKKQWRRLRTTLTFRTRWLSFCLYVCLFSSWVQYSTCADYHFAPGRCAKYCSHVCQYVCVLDTTQNALVVLYSCYVSCVLDPFSNWTLQPRATSLFALISQQKAQLSQRDRATHCATMSVEILSTDAQLYEKSHFT